jgi:single-stranded-DNA-specific exonuclease
MKSVWKTRHAGDLPPVEFQGPIPAPVKRVLASRGLTDATQIENFLFPKLQSLKDPMTMKNMDIAVDRFAKAYKDKEKIAVYCDFDLDGTSGLALMMAALRGFGYENLVPYQPSRLAEGYGFHPEAVEALAKENVSLIITVDVGITAVAAADKAKEVGVDVIITDHHLPAEELPKALAVVNPNQSGDTSGLGYLSGAGVAFYFLRALKRKLSEDGIRDAKEYDLKEVLEFFTIATLTDMVPLIDDNRVLVKHGLVRMSQTDRPGLKALKNILGLEGRELSSQDVAIKLAPKLNALSRMGSDILPIHVLLCDDHKAARQLVGRVLENNQVRVQMQAEAQTELENVLATAKSQPYVFMASSRFHRGLVGLLATKVSQDTQKPSFVGAIDPETGSVVGSARRPNGFDGCLVEILGQAKDHLKRFGGHSQAAGFEFEAQNLEAIKACFDKYFEEQQFKSIVPEVFYDTELEFSEISPQLMKWLEFLGPYGARFEAPVFCFKGVKLHGVKELKGGHLRLTCLSKEAQAVQEGLLFSPTPYQREILTERSTSYDILGELQWNYYNGQKNVQLLVKDLRVSLWQ